MKDDIIALNVIVSPLLLSDIVQQQQNHVNSDWLDATKMATLCI